MSLWNKITKRFRGRKEKALQAQRERTPSVRNGFREYSNPPDTVRERIYADLLDYGTWQTINIDAEYITEAYSWVGPTFGAGAFVNPPPPRKYKEYDFMSDKDYAAFEKRLDREGT